MKNKQYNISLLAPARDIEVGKAAIQAGADAIYIGAPEFGARQAAGNSLTDIANLVQYAHQFGVQVLVTLNTLLHEEEYPRACALAHELYKVGVDALILQDLNLLDYDLPPIRLHASTQCDNRTAEHVLHLQKHGFKRVVLARELSLGEIKNIHTAIQNATKEASILARQKLGSRITLTYDSERAMKKQMEQNENENKRIMMDIEYKAIDQEMAEKIAENKYIYDYNYIVNSTAFAKGFEAITDTQGEQMREAEDNMKKVEQEAERNRKARKQIAEDKWKELQDRLNNH